MRLNKQKEQTALRGGSSFSLLSRLPPDFDMNVRTIKNGGNDEKDYCC